MPSKCCRSTPRCRTCPLRFAAELRNVRALAADPYSGVPSHLAGVPSCLHKYEPLFRRAAAPEPDPVPLPVAQDRATELVS